MKCMCFVFVEKKYMLLLTHLDAHTQTQAHSDKIHAHITYITLQYITCSSYKAGKYNVPATKLAILGMFQLQSRQIHVPATKLAIMGMFHSIRD